MTTAEITIYLAQCSVCYGNVERGMLFVRVMMVVKRLYRKEVWYMVSLVTFKSLEAREEYLQKGMADFNTETIFFGRTEPWAAVRFYRACLQIHRDRLVQGVMIYRERKLVAWVSSGFPGTWTTMGLAMDGLEF